MRYMLRAASLGIVVASAVAACGPAQGELVPAAGARRLSAGDPSVVTESNGVQLLADATSWRGSPAVPANVAPVELSITNRRSQPVYAALADIWLAGAKGGLRALEPSSLRVRPMRTTVGMDPAQFDAPLGEPRASERRRSDEEIVAQQVTELAFRDGLVPIDQTVRGFVYFRRPDVEQGPLTLHVLLRSSPEGPIVAHLQIPFRVRY